MSYDPTENYKVYSLLIVSKHILGRKHRKFALTRDNWVDLDRLLIQLGRPLKEQNPDES